MFLGMFISYLPLNSLAAFGFSFSTSTNMWYYLSVFSQCLTVKEGKLFLNLLRHAGELFPLIYQTSNYFQILFTAVMENSILQTLS